MALQYMGGVLIFCFVQFSPFQALQQPLKPAALLPAARGWWLWQCRVCSTAQSC